MQIGTECVSSKQTMRTRKRWTAIVGMIGMLVAPPVLATDLLVEKALQASKAHTRARFDTKGYFVLMDWNPSPSSTSPPCVFKGVQPSYFPRFGHLNAVKCRHVKAALAAYDAFRDLADAPTIARECLESANVSAKTFLGVSRTILYADVAGSQTWRLRNWEPGVFRDFMQFDLNLDAIWSARAAASEAEFIASWKAGDRKADKYFSFWKTAYRDVLSTTLQMYRKHRSGSPFGGSNVEIDTLEYARSRASEVADRALEYLLDEADVAVSRVLACTRKQKGS